MDEITMSRPLASSTEGDDPCETDVTKVAIHSVMLFTCLCGLAGNGAVLRLTTINSITDFILDLAVGDFLFLLFALPSALLFLLEDVSCSTLMPLVYLRFLFQLSVVSYYWGLYRMTFLSIQRCSGTHCPLCCGCHPPQRLLEVVMSALYWGSLAVITGNPTVTFLCQSQEQKHCRAALISMHTLNLLLFAAAMLISSTVLLVNVKCGSQQQQPKRRDVVVVLIVLLTLLLNLCNFLQQLSYIAVSSQVVFLFACIHSTIKPLIYFSVGTSWRHCSMGSCWRHCSVDSLRKSLQWVFEEPEENTPSSKDAAMDTEV